MRGNDRSSDDAKFPTPAGVHPTTLGYTFVPWAKRQISNDDGVIDYTYWYHTHPFTKGDVVQGVVVGNPILPSLIHGDADVSKQIAHTGVIVTKTHFVVFDSSGTECLFKR
jgi:hypothetical protein